MIEHVETLRRQIRWMVLHELSFTVTFQETTPDKLKKLLDDWIRAANDRAPRGPTTSGTVDDQS